MSTPDGEGEPMDELKFKIRHGNFWPGTVLCAIGLTTLWIGYGYGVGDWMMVGGGAFPVLVSLVLIACGILIAIEDLFGRKHEVIIPFAALTAGTGLVGSISIFALTIETLGLIPASALSALVISLASRELKWTHTIGLVLVLPVFAWLVFSVFLGLQAPAFRLG